MTHRFALHRSCLRLVLAVGVVASTIPVPALAAVSQVRASAEAAPAAEEASASSEAGQGDASTPEEEGTEDAAADPRAQARALYQEGVSLFRLGKYEEALEKFEACYKLSSLPLILYNIALTQRELGERDRDPQRLRESTSMYRNFYRAMQRDPSLIDEASNITPTAIKDDIDALGRLIEELEAEEAARAEEAAEREAKIAAARGPTTPEGPDPGEPLRKKGKIWLAAGAGAGGVVMATGLALVGVYGTRASIESANAQTNEQNQINAMCDNPSNNVVDECKALINEADAINERGTTAQRNALVIGVPIAVVGAAVIATGIALGVIQRKKGEERTRRWREGAQVSIAPTLGGAVLSGRF